MFLLLFITTKAAISAAAVPAPAAVVSGLWLRVGLLRRI
jgi:hypothetical protein